MKKVKNRYTGRLYYIIPRRKNRNTCNFLGTAGPEPKGQGHLEVRGLKGKRGGGSLQTSLSSEK